MLAHSFDVFKMQKVFKSHYSDIEEINVPHFLVCYFSQAVGLCVQHEQWRGPPACFHCESAT